MSKSVKDILELIEQNDIKMIDFKMVDINGQFRHVTIPAGQFNESTLEGGIGLLANKVNASYFSMLGPLFTWKFL